MGSILCNLALAACVAVAVATGFHKVPAKVFLRYYTTLSNLLCGAAALLVALCRMAGTVPQWVLVVKYVGTVSVTVTMLTVVFFLAPHYGVKPMFGGRDLFLHLICPVLALASYFAWDKPAAPFGIVFLGVATVILYGAVYMYKVIRAPEEKRWEDFYTFNRDGKWKVSFAAMTAACFIISAALWAL